MTCNTDICGAVCCTFTVLPYPHRTDEVRRYFELHGIECKPDSADGFYLKLPLPCKKFNPETKRCMIYRNRPYSCRVYPKRPSPFIPVEKCSKLPR